MKFKSAISATKSMSFRGGVIHVMVERKKTHRSISVIVYVPS
jgi:hypothetical protein